MKTFILIISIVSSSFCLGQEDVLRHDYYWNQEENAKAIIGVKNCYVRLEPNLTSQILDSLQVGKEVTFIKSTENFLKIRGINVCWAQIEYKNNNGETQTGYLWKGSLALNFIKNKSNIYLTTIDKIYIKKEKEDFNPQYFAISVSILDLNSKMLDQKTIQRNVTESAFFTNKTIGNLGLKNLEDIYRISFGGQACGIGIYYYYFGWNGSKLLLLPEKYEVADAGAYYHSENFIFPKEKDGKPNLIIKIIEEAENIANSESDRFIFKITEWKEIYTWNGEKASFLKKEKPRNYVKKE